MSEKADRLRESRRRSMLPGSPRDSFVAVAKKAFPIASVCVLAVLVVLPLTAAQEFSFMLSKDNAAQSTERMRVQEASYRGETDKGEDFEILAQSAVQKSSVVQVVTLKGLTATLEEEQGPATVTAPSGEFHIPENRLVVQGPVVARSASGYSLDGKDIEVDIDDNRISTKDFVSGTLPMGKFEANSFDADIQGRTIVMSGGVKLRIIPGSDR